MNDITRGSRSSSRHLRCHVDKRKFSYPAGSFRFIRKISFHRRVKLCFSAISRPRTISGDSFARRRCHKRDTVCCSESRRKHLGESSKEQFLAINGYFRSKYLIVDIGQLSTELPDRFFRLLSETQTDPCIGQVNRAIGETKVSAGRCSERTSAGRNAFEIFPDRLSRILFRYGIPGSGCREINHPRRDPLYSRHFASERLLPSAKYPNSACSEPVQL